MSTSSIAKLMTLLDKAPPDLEVTESTWDEFEQAVREYQPLPLTSGVSPLTES